MTKKEAYKVLRSQLQNVVELCEEEDKWIYATMEPASSLMSSMLLTGEFNSERLQKFKDTLHMVDSIIANMDEHGLEHENTIRHERLFTFLHSLYDKLLYDLSNKFEDYEVE